MQKFSDKEVSAMFYSGQFGFVGDQEITSKIAFLINHSYLHCSTVTIANKNKNEYVEIASNQQVISDRDEASGGGTNHIALKLLAATYIKLTYGLDSLFEQPFAGYIPDVQSLDKSIVCECGHTNNPEKIFTYLKHSKVRAVIQIPYPTLEDIEITGYVFEAGDDLFPFLALESEKRSQSIKDILNRR